MALGNLGGGFAAGFTSSFGLDPNRLLEEERERRIAAQAGLGAASTVRQDHTVDLTGSGGAETLEGGGATETLRGGIRPPVTNDISAIVESAHRLGVSPRDYLALINYESGINPNRWGGKGGNYFGLIQFGPTERAEFGAREGQSIQEQLPAVEAYFRKRGLKPGMGLAEMYSIVNAGSLDASGQPRWAASDGNGTVRSHVANIAAEHYPVADRILGGAGADTLRGGTKPPPASAMPQPDADGWVTGTAAQVRAWQKAWKKANDTSFVAEAAKGLAAGAEGMVAAGMAGIGALTPTMTLQVETYRPQLARVSEMSDEEVSALQAEITQNAPPGPFADRLLGFIEELRSGELTIEEINREFPTPTPLADRKLIQWSKALRQGIDEHLGAAPAWQRGPTRVISEGLGSFGTGLLFAGLPGGQAAAAGLFVTAGMGESVERAMEWSETEKAAGRPGLTDQEIATVGLMGAAPGATDLVPLETLLGVLKVPQPFRGPIARIVGRIGGQAVIEGVQEGGQEFLQNIIAQTYDPSQDLGEGLVPAGGAGGAVGAIAQTMMEIFAPGRTRGGAGGSPPPAALPGETPPAAAEPPTAGGAPSPVVAPVVPPKGTLGRALDAGGVPAAAAPAAPGAPGPVYIDATGETRVAPSPMPAPPGMPPPNTPVTVALPEVDPFPATIVGYETEGAVTVADEHGELYEIPPELMAVTEGVAAVPPAPSSGEVAPAGQPEQAAPAGTAPAEGEALMAAITGELRAGRTVRQVFNRLRPQIAAFVGESERDGLDLVKEANRVLKGPQPISKQVPRPPKPVKVSGQRAPIEVDVGGRAVTFPDQPHAELYHLGQNRQSARMTSGMGGARVNRNLLPLRKKIAAIFDVEIDAVNRVADDYRYQIEQAAKGGTDPLQAPVAPVALRGTGAPESVKSALGPIMAETGVVTPVGPETVALPQAPAEVVTVDEAGHVAATSPENGLPEPTEGQKKAGNYQKGHTRIGRLDISIENPVGSERSGVDPSGKPWSVTMKSHYGYIRRTEGKDGDHLDVFIREGTPEDLPDKAPVFVVDQVKPGNRHFDEHKGLIGYADEAEARAAYLENYAEGWQGLGAITTTDLGTFTRWAEEGDTTKPIAAQDLGALAPPTGFGPAKNVDELVDRLVEDAEEGFTFRELAMGSGASFDKKLPRSWIAQTRRAITGETDYRRLSVLQHILNRLDEDHFPVVHKSGRGKKAEADYQAAVEARNANRVTIEEGRKEIERKIAGLYATAMAASGLRNGDTVRGPSRVVDPRSMELIEMLGLLHVSGATGHVVIRGDMAFIDPEEIAGLEKVPDGTKPKSFGFVDEEGEPAVEAPREEEGAAAATVPINEAAAEAPDVKTVRATMRSKEWKKVFGKAGDLFKPHPESEVAEDMVAGWLAAKAGEPAEAPEPMNVEEAAIARRGGFNPIDPWLIGYIGGRFGEAVEVRALAAPDIAEAINEGTRSPSGEVRDAPEAGATPPFGSGDQSSATNIGVHGPEVEPRPADKPSAARAKEIAAATANGVNGLNIGDVVEATNPSGRTFTGTITDWTHGIGPERELLAEVTSGAGKRTGVSRHPPASLSKVPIATEGATSQIVLANALKAMLPSRPVPGRASISSKDLQRAAEEAYGGTMAEGKFDRRDIAEALELAVNMLVRDDAVLRVDDGIWKPPVGRLGMLLQGLPTQTVRSEEQISFQQFSTPPNYAAAVAYAANLRPGDVVLEPSAGTGSIAAAGMAPGVTIIANELSERRADLLQELVGDRGQVFGENAEQLDNILPDDIRPTVVMMNPPFSQTAGRLGGKRDIHAGAKHIEQALNRLEPGGRLVSIVGRGMTMGAPAFKDWWKRIGGKYKIAANIGVDGKVYEKYGTGFATRVIVIDKGPPDGSRPTLADVDSIPALMAALEPVRDVRPAARTAEPAQPSRAETPAADVGRPGESATRPGAVGARPRPDEPGRGPAGSGEPGGRVGDVAPAGDRGLASPVSGGRAERPAEPGARPPRPARTAPLAAVGGQLSFAGDLGAVAGEPAAARGGDLRLERSAADRKLERVEAHTPPGDQHSELSDAVFDPYQAINRLKGAKAHPTRLVESAAMASVAAPKVAYVPSIDPGIVAGGQLSDAQLDAIMLAGAAHEDMLPAAEGETPKRRGFFIGDGTGVGKGREVSGIILDNWNRGRRKAVWVSEKTRLINDARRDWAGIGQDERQIFLLNNVKLGEPVRDNEGIIFVSYDTLRQGLSDQKRLAAGKLVRGQSVSVNGRSGTLTSVGKAPRRGDAPYAVKVRFDDGETVSVMNNELEMASGADMTVASRIDQVVDWLGPEFDGVVALDESHAMGNAQAVSGEFGLQSASQKALAGIELQRRLPNARVVYLSATGATEVRNLAYAERLGLWGKGTPFPDRNAFVNEIEGGGIAAMELVARDMKALGSYTARGLSYDGVEYRRIEHVLTSTQREIYDTLADAWQVVLQNFNTALDADHTNASPAAKKAARSQFWSSHQRFFNQIITSMQMPSVIEAAEQDLAEGRQVVMQLVNTNEADQKRAAAKKAASGEETEDLDITPKDQLIQLIEKSFPTQQYETRVDEDGNEYQAAVVDSEGKPVENAKAVRMREALIDRVASVRVPQGPLDLIIDHFGTDTVAEVTGRKTRYVIKEDADGNRRRQEESRSGSANAAEIAAFQGGKKRVLVFSMAGGTGASYHADRAAPSKDARRSHYLVQAGWRADQAVQGFGRSHRSNQESAPIFGLVTTDLHGQKRFISSIARRLAQLGALTKGQRQASDQGMFSARDNLEGREADLALHAFFSALMAGRIPGVGIDELERQTGLELRVKTGEEGGRSGFRRLYPPIQQFLNRLLSMKIDMQNRTFEAFSRYLDEVIEDRRRRGVLDAGLETIRADKIRKETDRVVHTHKATGAESRHVKVILANRFKPTRFPEASKVNHFIGYYRSQSGKVWAAAAALPETDPQSGAIVDYAWIGSPVSESRRIVSAQLGGREDSAYRRIDAAEAERLWSEETRAAPEFIEKERHLITGVILPIWDRLKGDTRVVRLRTDDGERILGRIVGKKALPQVLKALGADMEGVEGPKIEPDALLRRILGEGLRAKLANGWELKRSYVAGERRVELIGPASFSEGEAVKKEGVFTERISYDTRYFVPVGDDRVLRAVIEYRPVASLEGGAGPAAGAAQEDEGRYSVAPPREPVASLTGEEIGHAPNMAALGRKVDAWYRSNLQGTSAINAASGRVIRFGAAGRRKSTSGKGEDLLRTVAGLRSIIEQGRFFGDPVADNRRHPDIKAAHTLEATVELGGRPIDVVVVIRETADGEFYYDLRKDNRPGARWAISEPSAERLAPEGQVRLPTMEGDAGTADWNIAIREPSGKRAPAGEQERVIAALRQDPAIAPLVEPLLASGRLRIDDAPPPEAPPRTMAWAGTGGIIHLIAPELGDVTETRATLLHEAFHGAIKWMVGSKAWERLLKRLGALYRDAGRSKGRNGAFFADARRHIENLNRERAATGLPPLSETITAEEMGAYAISFREAAPKVWRDWVDDALGAVKAWVFRRFGIQPGKVTPAQLRALAIAALRSEVRRHERRSSAQMEPRYAQGDLIRRRRELLDRLLETEAEWGSVGPGGRSYPVGRAVFIFAEVDGRRIESPGTVDTDAKGNPVVRLPSGRHVRFRDIGQMTYAEQIPGRPPTPEQVMMWPPRPPPEGQAGYSAIDEETRYAIRPATAREIVEKAKAMPEEGRMSLLSAIPLNYLTDFARPGQTAIGDYIDLKRQMDAYRGEWMHRADRQAAEWRKVAGKDAVSSKALSDLMHESTLAQTDPTKTTRSEREKPEYARLRAAYDALPAAQQRLYSEIRDAYKAQTDELDKVILENIEKTMGHALEAHERAYHREMKRIERSGVTAKEREDAETAAHLDRVKNVLRGRYANKARLSELRRRFESSRLAGPYFPLGRFGDYFVTIRAPTGEVESFTRFDTNREMREFIRLARAEDPGADIEHGVMSNRNEVRGAMSAMDPRVVGEIGRLLENAGVPEDVMDAIWQRYLAAMPDVSIRKRYIHRKGTEGFHRDALRTFASHMFHASHQMARLKHSPDMNEAVEQASEQARGADDPVAAGKVANELRLRHQWVMNPKSSSGAVALTQLGFLYYLGATPAAALVNLTQTTMVAYPIMAARFGGAKAAKELGKASVDFVKGKGGVQTAPNLTEEQRKALEWLYDAGALDRSRAMDIAGLAEEGVEHHPLRAKVMEKIAWMFHHAERMNREVTALAAFRLARAAGQDFEQAVKTAGDVTWKAHFDYSSSNRARILQGDIARVVLLFRNFQINMLYRLGRDFHQMFRGESPQARKEARLQFAGIMGMMALHAGALGVPFMGTAMWIIDILRGLFGDDDPRSTEQMIRANVKAVVGEHLATIITEGVPGALAGISLRERIGLPTVWFRGDDRDQTLQQSWLDLGNEMLGPVWGITSNFVRAIETIRDGKGVVRGVEVVAPKAVKDLMKAWRYASEGALSSRGDPILEKGDLGPAEIFAQAVGFTPLQLAEQYRRNTEKKNIEHRVMEKRSRLLGDYYEARRGRDREGLQDAIEAIRAFNRVPLHRGVTITGDTIERSMRSRQSTSRKMESGIVVSDPELNRDINRLMATP